MSAPVVYKVVYTRDGHKKSNNRRWLDGRVLWLDDKKQTRLQDEDGHLVATSAKPLTKQDLVPGGDEFEFSPRILVMIDTIHEEGGEENTEKAQEKGRGTQLGGMPIARPRGRRTLAVPLKCSLNRQSSSFEEVNASRHGGMEGIELEESGPAARTDNEILQILMKNPCVPLEMEEGLKRRNTIQNTLKSADETGFINTSRHLDPIHRVSMAQCSKRIFETETIRVCSPGTCREQQETITAIGYQPSMKVSNKNAWTRERKPIETERKRLIIEDMSDKRLSRPSMHGIGSDRWRTFSGEANQKPNSKLSHMAHTVRFLSDEECRCLQRTVSIPSRFASLHCYQRTWEQAIFEEMTLRLAADVAKRFHDTLKSFMHHSKPKSESTMNMMLLECMMRKSGVSYYHHCELFVWKDLKRSNAFKATHKRKKRHTDDLDEPDESTVHKPKAEQTYLVLKSGRRRNQDYHRKDLWILSSHPFFQSTAEVRDRCRSPWVAVAYSLWHGPNQDGKFEIEWLSPKPSHLGRTTPVYAIHGTQAHVELEVLDLVRRELPSHQTPLIPYLLGGLEANSSQHHALYKRKHDIESATGFRPPTISGRERYHHQASRQESGSEHNCAAEDDGSPRRLAMEVIQRFNLNEEQAEVVHHVATWTEHQDLRMDGRINSLHSEDAPRCRGASPVCLVHGPFGTGKSTLLVAILHLILQLRERTAGDNPLLQNVRVLVSAHTNVAVDRILVALLESGCKDFLRVGPLRRIDRRLLSQSLHASDSSKTSNAVSEVKEMIKEARHPHELAALKEELKRLSQGAERKKTRRLRTSPIVGVTCCSSLLAVLDDQRFDIVMLDECSQMIEPLSLAPCVRAKCRFLIAAGDPKQLPPVVAYPSLVSLPHDTDPRQEHPLVNDDFSEEIHSKTTAMTSASASSARPCGSRSSLSRPLFVRLQELGMTPHFLRRQYRCHPMLSDIPNSMFYEGRLLDGCTTEQRPSLLPGLPAIVLVDVRGIERHGVGGSTSNAAEVSAVVVILRKLLKIGISAARVGVICFFRAQAESIRQRLDEADLDEDRMSNGKALLESSEACLERGFKDNTTTMPHELENRDDVHLGQEHEGGVQVATVDAFQGSEKDVILLTTSKTKVSEFAADPCRLNVALTRARHNLIVVGHAKALQESAPAFARLVKLCKSHPGGYAPNGQLPDMPTML